MRRIHHLIFSGARCRRWRSADRRRYLALSLCNRDIRALLSNSAGLISSSLVTSLVAAARRGSTNVRCNITNNTRLVRAAARKGLCKFCPDSYKQYLFVRVQAAALTHNAISQTFLRRRTITTVGAIANPCGLMSMRNCLVCFIYRKSSN